MMVFSRHATWIIVLLLFAACKSGSEKKLSSTDDQDIENPKLNACVGESSLTCTVPNGFTNKGIKARECKNSVWTLYSDCKVARDSDCIEGFTPSGNGLSCTEKTCSGTSLAPCTVTPYGLKDSGTLTRTCNHDTWSEPYGPCLLLSADGCEPTYTTSTDFKSCIEDGSVMIIINSLILSDGG
jgi:hypothetical protein